LAGHKAFGLKTFYGQLSSQNPWKGIYGGKFLLAQGTEKGQEKWDG
jgi:hypothetical protein